LITIHNYGVRIWDCDLVQKRILFQDLNMGQIKRIYNCIAITPDDSSAFLGTLTGDIIEINLDRRLYKKIGPANRLFQKGINVMKLLNNNDIIIGAGDGTVARLDCASLKIKSEAKLAGACTSISVTADGTHFFAGSAKATMYWCNTDSISPELRNTCHYERINDICFP
jgi:hypothetical protein